MSEWTFFTNHGHVIFVLSTNPHLTLKEVANEVGITERATQKIIADLEKDGFIKIKKEGRNNHYTVVGRKRLRHKVEKKSSLKDIIKAVKKS